MKPITSHLAATPRSPFGKFIAVLLAGFHHYRAGGVFSALLRLAKLFIQIFDQLSKAPVRLDFSSQRKLPSDW